MHVSVYVHACARRIHSRIAGGAQRTFTLTTGYVTHICACLFHMNNHRRRNAAAMRVVNLGELFSDVLVVLPLPKGLLGPMCGMWGCTHAP